MTGRCKTWIDRNFSKAATLSGWLNMAISTGGNLVILPLVFDVFGKEKAGLWFFLLQWVAFFQLCDFGISQTLSRQVSFSLGSKLGRPRERARKRFLRIYGTHADRQIFLEGKRIIRWISWAMLLAGTVLERTMLFGGKMETGIEGHLTWYLVLAMGIVTNEARVFSTWLTGRMLGQWERLYAAIGLAAQMGLVIAALLLHAPLWSVGAAFLLGAVGQFLLQRSLFRRHGGPSEGPRPRPKGKLLRAIWSMSWEQGVATTAAFFIFSINPLLIGYFLGNGSFSEYFIPLRIGNILQTALFSLFVPQLNLMITQVSNQDEKGVVLRFSKLLLITSSTGLISYGLFVASGSWFIRIWTSGAVVVETPILLAFAAYFYLAVLQTLCACFVLAHGSQPFAKVAVAGALLNLGLAIAWIPKIGLMGAALATLLAQALTSNWYIPLRAFVFLRMHLRNHGADFLKTETLRWLRIGR